MSTNFINKGGGSQRLPDETKFQNSIFTTFKLNNFDTSKLTTMEQMFYFCLQLTSIDLDEINAKKVISMNGLLLSCSQLISATLRNMKLHKPVTMGNMFSGCTRLTSVDFSGGEKYYPSSMYAMFQNCSSLVSLNLANLDTSECTVADYMFKGCTNLVNVDISHFDLSKCAGVSPLGGMFESCSSLSNDSMNSILKALSGSGQRMKQLKLLGFTEEQAEICTTLPNWSLCEEAGWRTGY